MDTHLIHYLIIVAFGVLALAVACVPLLIARILGPKKPNKIKQATYECGLEASGDPWGKFKVQYYLYALVFVIFDIEAVFLYPWATAFTSIGFGGFMAMSVFILILAESLVYLWIKGFLEWK
jgi:NADH:ubiquinone oxidoreductase subunit 3 (subunit A)